MFTSQKCHWNRKKLVSTLQQLFIYIGLPHIHTKKCKCFSPFYECHSTFFMDFFGLLPVLSLVSAVLWAWSDSVWSQESDQSIINTKTNVVIILMLIYLAWISHQHSVLTLFLLSYDSNILLTVIPSIVFHQAEIIMLTKSKWLCAHIINPVITFIKVVAIIHK